MIQLGLLSIRDVNARADIPVERAVGLEARHARVENPAIFPIEPSQAIFHAEFLARVKGSNISIQALLQIVGVNPLAPAVAELLPHGSAGEIEPGLVEVGAKFVRIGHPDHDRRFVG